MTNPDKTIWNCGTTNLRLERRGDNALRGRATWRVLVLVCLCLFPVISTGQAKDEYAVKAAFVFNLTKYVEWPSSNSKEIIVGFIGEGPMGTTLHQVLSGKATGSKTVRVIVEPSKEELQRCNILYVSYSSLQKIRSVFERIPSKNVLTVGDSPLFTKWGGVVGLITTGDHVQIQINPAAAEAAQLKISSRLLSLAALVSQAPAR